jgi:hypothetical protein
MYSNTAQRHAAVKTTGRVEFLSRVPPAGVCRPTIHAMGTGENNDGAIDPAVAARQTGASHTRITRATLGLPGEEFVPH